MKYLNVAVHIVAIASLAALAWTLREDLLGAVALITPLLLVLYLSRGWRRYAIKEIDAAGGYDAWRQKYGPVAPH